MKKNWKTCKIKDIAEVVMGQSPPSSTYNKKNIGLPFYQGIVDFGRRFVSERVYCNEPKKIIDENYVLLSVRAPVGKVNLAKGKCAIGRGNAGLKMKNGEKLFLFYLLKYYEKNFHSNSDGTVFSSINKSTIENLQIEIPPLPEQKAIAAVLSSLDDKIDLLHRQNKTLEALAETMFRQWFVDSDYKNTIGDLIELQNGYAFKSKDFKDLGNDRIIKIKNISGGIIDIENCDFVDSSVVKKIDKSFCISSGDILFAMTGAKIGKMGIIPPTDYRLWLNQRVGLFKEKYKGSRFLAYLHLKSDFGIDYIENTATGSAQPNISGTDIENCEFPTISEKQAIEYSERLSVLYQKVIFNLGQIRTLEKLRDTLLPKLMSGEIRVKIKNEE